MAGKPQPFSKLAEELIGELRGVAAAEPRRSTKRPTRKLGEAIELLLDKYQIGRDAPIQTIRERWAELVGTANAAYSHPVRLERNLLTVLTSHAVVRNEIFLHRTEIVARVRQLPGCGALKALNVRAG